jgi:glutamine synthetase
MDQFRRGLESDFGLIPVTAAELEFYYSGDEDVLEKSVCATVLKFEKERGKNQYEVAFAPAKPEKTVADLIAFKDAAEKLGADFSAKPYADQPGSGLHIHIHLMDKNGKNVFYKDDAVMSDPLKYAIGGLLAALPESMPIFAPNPESRARFQPGGNAPTTVSWGANNRTVAIRLPDKPHDSKHIEHRVAGADADPQAVMTAILDAIHDGLTRKLDPGPQIYGDASLEMYKLPKLA